MVVASVCGFASADASPARRRTHEIVELMTQRHRSGEGEYGGPDGDPGSSGGSTTSRRSWA